MASRFMVAEGHCAQLESVCAGLHMPSRASSGALHRLSALRHLVRTQRPATDSCARNMQRLFNHGVRLPLLAVALGAS